MTFAFKKLEAASFVRRQELCHLPSGTLSLNYTTWYLGTLFRRVQASDYCHLLTATNIQSLFGCRNILTA